jgi:hypothetical protein
MAAWDKWQKDAQGREIISGYEMKARRQFLRWCEAEMAKTRPACVESLRTKQWQLSRNDVVWKYLLARHDLNRARASISNAVVAKNPNASPYQRARRGYDAIPKTQ